MRVILNRVLISTILLVWFGCATQKSQLHKSGGVNEVIENAILDFSTTRIFNKGSIFSVNYNDNHEEFALQQAIDGIYEWLPSKSNENISTVSITMSSAKFPYNSNDLGRSSIPTAYKVVEDKLFYWWEGDGPISEEAIEIFKRYDLLVLNSPSSILDSGVDDSQKGVHYYFCKNDLLSYKRVITSKGLGYYSLDPPLCN
ncbi:MAG: hypothetical protein GY816_18055 [Cytophagales bacterium]|nr:hypothetical protein [Cytophagales bacterium]